MTKDTTIAELIMNHFQTANELIKVFCQKNLLHNPDCIGGEGSMIYCFEEYYIFSISDIILDLSSATSPGTIMKWFESNQINSEQGGFINYSSYLKGARHSNSNKPDSPSGK